MGSSVFKTMLFDAMQHLVLYNFNNSIATLLLRKKKKTCRIVLYLRKGLSSSRTRYISNAIMGCPVQCSYGQPYSGTRFCCHWKFTLPEAPLASSVSVHVFTSLSFSHPCIIPFLSPLESAGFLLIPHSCCNSLFLPVISPILWKVWLGRN